MEHDTYEGEEGVAALLDVKIEEDILSDYSTVESHNI